MTGFIEEKKTAKAWVEIYPNNRLVTDWYIRSIGSVFANLGFSVEYVDDCTKVGSIHCDLYFVSVAKSAAILAFKGCRHLVYWAQGIAPEEDFLRFNSRLRERALAACEKTALRHSERIFVVSNSMLCHFEKKYRLNLREKSFIAPCCNENLHVESFFAMGKYDRPIFTYAGGLSKYQCIDQMLDLFSAIRDTIPDAKLLFYTWDVLKAKELVLKHNISNVVVESKKQDELSEALSCAKYGFVIRDDITVNRVATPTKISTYMSNGVIPVVSSCVESFAEASHGLEYVICRPDADMVGVICDMESREIDASEVLCEYQGFFDRYFNFESKRGFIKNFLAPVARDMGL